jgi:hypothetical protein
MLHQRQQAQNQMQSQSMFRIFWFADRLAAYTSTEGQPNDLNYWRQFVAQNFAEDGRMRFTVRSQSDPNSTKDFEVVASILPRYFWTYFESGGKQIQLIPQNTMQKPAGDGLQNVTAERAQMVYHFSQSDKVVFNIRLRALFRGDKIEIIWFDTQDWDYFVPRSRLEALCSVASPDQNKSPKMVKNAKNKNQAKAGAAAAASTFDRRNLPSPPVNDYGVTSQVFAWLEVCRTFICFPMQIADESF